MTMLLYPATGKYLLNPAPEHLHDEVIQWVSDLEFYKTEFSFFRKLLDKAFLRLQPGHNLAELQALEEKLKTFQAETAEELHMRLVRHERELSGLDMDMFKSKKNVVEQHHSNLYAELQQFFKDARQLKKELFNLVEQQLKMAKQVSREFEEGKLSL